MWVSQRHRFDSRKALSRLQEACNNVLQYSGFFDNGKRNDTGLHAYLQAQDVTELVVMGLATDYCVKFTVLDALALGYRVKVVRAGCRAVNLQPGDGDNAFAEMQAAGATLV